MTGEERLQGCWLLRAYELQQADGRVVHPMGEQPEGLLFYSPGGYMSVLIAVEIFINIRLYLGTNIFPAQLVVATALMAIARKVIVLDFDTLTPMYLLGIAATTLALGITYWLFQHGSLAGK